MTPTTLFVIVGGMLLATIASMIVLWMMRARCPYCGSHKVIEDPDDGQLRCFDCNTIWHD